MSVGRVRSLYALMDSAYDCREIRAYDLSLGHKPIIDANPRRSTAMKAALKAENKARRTLGFVFPEDARYVEHSTVERVNGRLKDEFERTRQCRPIPCRTPGKPQAQGR